MKKKQYRQQLITPTRRQTTFDQGGNEEQQHRQQLVTPTRRQTNFDSAGGEEKKT